MSLADARKRRGEAIPRRVCQAAIDASADDPIVVAIEEAVLRDIDPRAATAGSPLCLAAWRGLVAARHYRIREIAKDLGLPYPVRYDPLSGVWSVP